MKLTFSYIKKLSKENRNLKICFVSKTIFILMFLIKKKIYKKINNKIKILHTNKDEDSLDICAIVI